MPELTLAEAQADLDATDRDIQRLERIVENLRGFITDSAGENRSRFRVDVMRYESLLREGRELRETIKQAIETL